MNKRNRVKNSCTATTLPRTHFSSRALSDSSSREVMRWTSPSAATGRGDGHLAMARRTATRAPERERSSLSREAWWFHEHHRPGQTVQGCRRPPEAWQEPDAEGDAPDISGFGSPRECRGLYPAGDLRSRHGGDDRPLQHGTGGGDPRRRREAPRRRRFHGAGLTHCIVVCKLCESPSTAFAS